MKQYTGMLAHVLEHGQSKDDRTGTGTRSVFGYQARFDLSQGFPLVTVKKTNFKTIVHELVWFLSGDTNQKYLTRNNVKIWNEWADQNDDLGPIYGRQWRSWPTKLGYTIDQIQNAVDLINTDPQSRRNIVSAWNPEFLPYTDMPPNENPKRGHMALAPCHTMFQFYCSPDGELSLQLYQRSADVFLGVPFNIASYALLLKMIAKITGKTPGELIISYGDLHLYNNHIDQAKRVLEREPLSLPKLVLPNDKVDLNDFTAQELIDSLQGYQSHGFIKAPVAV